MERFLAVEVLGLAEVEDLADASALVSATVVFLVADSGGVSVVTATALRTSSLTADDSLTSGFVGAGASFSLTTDATSFGAGVSLTADGSFVETVSLDFTTTFGAGDSLTAAVSFGVIASLDTAVSFGMGAGAGACLQLVSPWVAATVGLVSVFTSVMVYVDTKRPAWSLMETVPRFFGTVVIAWLIGASVIDPRFEPVAALVAMLDDTNLHARYGACEALALLNAAAAPCACRCRTPRHWSGAMSSAGPR